MIKELNIDNTIKFIPILGSILILSGIINADAYYSYFNIDINNFITFSESLTLFLNNIIGNIIFTFLMMLSMLLFHRNYSKLVINLKENGQKNDTYIKRVILKFTSANFFWVVGLSLAMVVISLFILGISGILKTPRETLFWINIYWLSIIIIAIAFYTFIPLLFKDDQFKKITSNLFALLILFFCFKYNGVSQAYRELKSKNKVTVVISFKNNTLLTIDSSKIYLGKTNSHYFYYDKVQKISNAISAELVSEVSFKAIE